MKEMTCFVVGPIGNPDTPQRTAADWLLHCIIKPVLQAKEFGFKVVRADEIAQPGLITDQIINLVMEADLVVADLTDHNANAFYELAIRHMEERPTIHMIRADQLPPFDIKDYRAILYKLERPQDLEAAKSELTKQVEAVLASDFQVGNPITHARGRRKLADSADPAEKLVASLMDAHSEMRAVVNQLASSIREMEARIWALEPQNPLELYNALMGGRNPPSRIVGKAPKLGEIFAAGQMPEGFPDYTPPSPKKPGAVS